MLKAYFRELFILFIIKVILIIAAYHIFFKQQAQEVKHIFDISKHFIMRHEGGR